MDQLVANYLAQNQCAPQWRAFLQAIGAELFHQGNETLATQLLRNTGVRFAGTNSLTDGDTLADAQTAMNRYWRELQWGWVVVEEKADHLLIRHFCSPLRTAFGSQLAHCSAAFLEGVYDTWMQQLGAGSDLAVRQATELDPHGSVDFRFSAHDPIETPSHGAAS